MSKGVRKEVSWSELVDEMQAAYDRNEELYGLVVFTEDSFNEPYREFERTYEVNNISSKGLQTGKISSSIWANCLDGEDIGIRLDWYMFGEDAWKVEKCYLLVNENKEEK